MPDPAPQHVLIVGAGLAGSLLAVMLARLGLRVSVYERRADPRAQGYAGGRSINLALSLRGIEGMKRAGGGLAERVMGSDAIAMRGRMLHPVRADSKLVFQPYSASPADAINSVSRGGLNLTLLTEAAALPNVRFVFDRFCTDIDLLALKPAAFFKPVTPQKPIPDIGRDAAERVEADLILSADGAFSAGRMALQRTDRFEYSQSSLAHGYKELTIPPARDGSFALDPNALHIWPRSSAMMIALPNKDASFTCTLFWPFDPRSPGDTHAFSALKTPDQILAHFQAHYPDAVPLMPSLVEDFQRNPASSLTTVRCWPWRWEGKLGLLGDAAHAIVPFYGQGMNCAFEDCACLLDCLTAHGAGAGRIGDAAAALEQFQHLRKPNADAIADMALDNFIEMRDKVGDPAFLYRKKTEQALHKMFPESCEPQYHLVSFSTVPYAEARRRGQDLEGLYDAVIAALPVGSPQTLGEDAWLARVKEVGGQALHAGAHSVPDRPIIDISPALTADIKTWPGDTPFSREVICDMAQGANITLSTLRSTVHLGAHADGPNHYSHPAPGVGEWPLDRYLGPCQVLAVNVPLGERVTPAHVLGGLDQIRHPRILLKTGTFPDPTTWREDFAALSVELVDALADRAVFTIGIDCPSVDLFSSKDLPAHKAIARRGMAILEGVSLAHVPPGEYELIALPLKLMGFDGSPVRAALRPLA